MSCIHVDFAELRPPGPNQSVYREDCTQCFDSIDDPTGLDVCLSCFNGGCTGDRSHAVLHAQSTSHPLVLNIRRTRKKVKREEPPQKVTKLAIAAETEADRYDTATRVKCYACGVDDVDATAGRLPAVVDAVLKANTFARQAEVKAWEQELTPCEHTLCLEQAPARKIDDGEMGHCSQCELRQNLWLCLACGNLGCGRAQFGGVGGNSHGLAHTKETAHPVAVKLGSLTADGTADVYCYACDDERVDPGLAAHLAHWGINIADRQKTEKSLTEMQIEQNLLWEFSMTTEDGREMPPVFGPGFTGLKNLGNSCYLASVLQALFAMPEFARRYYLPDEPPPEAPAPAEDLETQLRKVADGLLSGRYSVPEVADASAASADSPEVPRQRGLAPAMLKHFVGRGHAEFSTMRQQDAFELLLHLLKLVARSRHPAQLGGDPVAAFRFAMEQRLQCLGCGRVRYRVDEMDNISIPVPIRRLPRKETPAATADDAAAPTEDEFVPTTLQECLDLFTAPETVELACPACPSTAGFAKRTLFKTLPAVLAVNTRRFEVVDWVPTKRDIAVNVGDTPFDFAPYLSPGPQEDEELLPDDDGGAGGGGGGGGGGFVPDATALAMLEAMGFPRVRCEKALHATGNADAEAASNWLFAHMEDPDIDEPVDLGGGGGAGGGGAGKAAADPAQIEMLTGMGFGVPQARQALKETGGDVERAVDWLFSHPDAAGDFGEESADGAAAEGEGGAAAVERTFPGSGERPARYALQSIVCHKGGSMHAGHYVAFVRKPVPPGATYHLPGAGNADAAPGGGGEEAWVLYNDERVARAPDAEEMKKFAYVYFFRRV